LVRW